MLGSRGKKRVKRERESKNTLSLSLAMEKSPFQMCETVLFLSP